MWFFSKKVKKLIKDEELKTLEEEIKIVEESKLKEKYISMLRWFPHGMAVYNSKLVTIKEEKYGPTIIEYGVIIEYYDGTTDFIHANNLDLISFNYNDILRIAKRDIEGQYISLLKYEYLGQEVTIVDYGFDVGVNKPKKGNKIGVYVKWFDNNLNIKVAFVPNHELCLLHPVKNRGKKNV